MIAAGLLELVIAMICGAVFGGAVIAAWMLRSR